MRFKLSKWDNLHYDGNIIDGYDKPFNYIISPRELGKTTWFWVKKAYKKFCQNKGQTLVLRYQIADITQAYIDDIENCINQFVEEPIKFVYKHTFGSGIVDIYLRDENDELDLFLRVLGISNPMGRIKSLLLPRIEYIVHDEFVLNVACGEKYPTGLITKFNEIYNTFYRANPKLKCYFLGNCYSKYHPYFVNEGFETNKMLRGSILVKKKAVLHVADLGPELRELILKKNPLYDKENDYVKYAFEGQAVNDMRIPVLDKQPEGFKLRHVFRVEGKYLYVYYKPGPKQDWDCAYWAKVREDFEVSDMRSVYCFDFNELVAGTVLLASEDKAYFMHLMNCVRFRRIKYETIEASYLLEEIYTCTKK